MISVLLVSRSPVSVHVKYYLHTNLPGVSLAVSACSDISVMRPPHDNPSQTSRSGGRFFPLPPDRITPPDRFSLIDEAARSVSPVSVSVAVHISLRGGVLPVCCILQGWEGCRGSYACVGFCGAVVMLQGSFLGWGASSAPPRLLPSYVRTRTIHPIVKSKMVSRLGASKKLPEGRASAKRQCSCFLGW
jgi:hypothetical protein